MQRLTKTDYKFIQNQLERDLEHMYASDVNLEHRINLNHMIEKLKVLRKKRVK